MPVPKVVVDLVPPAEMDPPVVEPASKMMLLLVIEADEHATTDENSVMASGGAERIAALSLSKFARTR